MTALIAAWSATKFKRHCFSVAFGAICGIAGYGIWLGSDSAAAEARYGGLYLVAIAGYINGELGAAVPARSSSWCWCASLTMDVPTSPRDYHGVSTCFLPHRSSCKCYRGAT